MTRTTKIQPSSKRELEIRPAPKLPQWGDQLRRLCQQRSASANSARKVRRDGMPGDSSSPCRRCRSVTPYALEFEFDLSHSGFPKSGKGRSATSSSQSPGRLRALVYRIAFSSSYVAQLAMLQPVLIYCCLLKWVCKQLVPSWQH